MLAAGAAGRFRVESPQGLPVFAEAYKDAAREQRLALPPGAYRVVLTTSAEEGLATDVRLEAGEVRSVGQAELVTRVVVPQVRDRGGDAAPGFRAPFTSDAVTALAVGFHAGRHPTQASTAAHAVGLGYAASRAPFALPGTEHGLDLAYRFVPGRFFVGARIEARSSSLLRDGVANTFRRVGAGVQGGAQFTPMDRITLMPWVAAGARAIWREREGRPVSGDLTAPFLEAGGTADVRLWRRLGAFAEVRGDVTWVAIDGRRRPFFEPLVGAGFSWRL